MKEILAILAIFLLVFSSAVVIAEEHDVCVEDCDEEDQEEECEEEECEEEIVEKAVVKDNAPAKKESNPGSGSFFLKKGVKLFGLKSQKDGFYGGGVLFGNIFEGKPLKLYVHKDILTLTIFSHSTERGLGAYHLKKVNKEGSIYAYEFLSNLEGSTYAFYVKVPTHEEVTFLLNGKELTSVEINEGKSKTFKYYNVFLEDKGLFEVKLQ